MSHKKVSKYTNNAVLRMITRQSVFSIRFEFKNKSSGIKLISAMTILVPSTVGLIQTYSGDNGGSKDDRVGPVPRVAVYVPGDGHTLARSL